MMLVGYKHGADTWHSVLCAMTMALVMEVEKGI